MQADIIFSNQNVSQFCEITCDNNLIHNPEHMHQLNKQVVVPGMFVFSTALNLLHDAFTQGADTIKVFFNSVIHTNESVRFEGKKNSQKPMEILMSANNGHDSFTLKDERSKVYKRSSDYTHQNLGFIRSLKYTEMQLGAFNKLIGCVDQFMNGFLFSIAYASSALFQAIQNPITEVESEINILIDKSLNPDRVAPFYQSLEIYLENGLTALDAQGELDYKIDFVREKQYKTYVAHVRCQQNGRKIYQSDYKMISVPERLIMRMVRDK
jgi:hypothetical protein